MIASVVGQYHWTPGYIDALFLDEIDYHGLTFWYERVKEIVDKMKKETETKLPDEE